MKLIIILFTLFSANECVNKKNIADVQSDAYTIEYTSISRGTYLQVIATKKTISIYKERGAEPVTKHLTKEEWEQITNSLKSISLKNIESIEPPSKAHQYDGAPLANLQITTGDQVYKTRSFDHGNPPKEIAALVKEILSLAENIE